MRKALYFLAKFFENFVKSISSNFKKTKKQNPNHVILRLLITFPSYHNWFLKAMISSFWDWTMIIVSNKLSTKRHNLLFTGHIIGWKDKSTSKQRKGRQGLLNFHSMGLLVCFCFRNKYKIDIFAMKCRTKCLLIFFALCLYHNQLHF